MFFLIGLHTLNSNILTQANLIFISPRPDFFLSDPHPDLTIQEIRSQSNSLILDQQPVTKRF